MKTGDIVYLKSGGSIMTAVKLTPEGWLLNWLSGPILYSGVFPEVCLTTINPEPAITKATEDLRLALQPAVIKEVVV